MHHPSRTPPWFLVVCTPQGVRSLDLRVHPPALHPLVGAHPHAPFSLLLRRLAHPRALYSLSSCSLFLRLVQNWFAVYAIVCFCALSSSPSNPSAEASVYRMKGRSKIGCASIGADDSLLFSSSKEDWHASDQGIGIFEL